MSNVFSVYWYEGVTARIRTPAVKNPYQENTFAAIEWNKGWDNAEECIVKCSKEHLSNKCL